VKIKISLRGGSIWGVTRVIAALFYTFYHVITNFFFRCNFFFTKYFAVTINLPFAKGRPTVTFPSRASLQGLVRYTCVV
jgi:hypothetical protein